MVRKHGQSSAGKRTKEYIAWRSMKARCADKENQDYGAQGITVSPEWAASFAAFFRDMGKSPSKSHTLDRIDSTKGYEHGNCRWATRTVQSVNRSCTRFIEYEGLKLCVTEWARRKGLTKRALFDRLDKGWSIAEALETPLRKTARTK